MSDEAKAVEEMANRATGSMESTVQHTPAGDLAPDSDPDEHKEEFGQYADLLDDAEAGLDDEAVGIDPPKEEPKLPDEKDETDDDTEVVEEEVGDKVEEVKDAKEETVEEVKESQLEPKTQEELQAELTKAREDMVEKLVDTFKLTEEEADQFITSPQDVVPRLMANLYVNM